MKSTPPSSEAEYVEILRDFVFRYTRIHFKVAELYGNNYRGLENWDKADVERRAEELEALAKFRKKLKIDDAKNKLFNNILWQEVMATLEAEKKKLEGGA